MVVWILLDVAGPVEDRIREALNHIARIGFGMLEAIAVYLIAWLASKTIRRPLRRRLRRTLLPQNIQTLVISIFRAGVFLVATTVIFGIWGLTLSGFLAAVSVSTIILALGFQSALQSFLGGTFILLERPFGVGDHIKFSGQDIEGVVTEIGMRTISLKNDLGEQISAPNALIFTLGVTNLTPNRSSKTVLRISDINESSDDVRNVITKAIALEPSLPAPLEIRFRNRISRTSVPFEELKSDLPASLSKLSRSVVKRARDVEIIWSGALEPVSIKEATDRFHSAFPDSTIACRRH